MQFTNFINVKLGMYGLYRHVQSIPVRTVYTGMYGLYLYVRSIPVCTVYTGIYGLYRHVQSIPVCTVYTCMYGLYQYVRSIPGLFLKKNVVLCIPITITLISLTWGGGYGYKGYLEARLINRALTYLRLFTHILLCSFRSQQFVPCVKYRSSITNT